MGEVYRGLDMRNLQWVAIKIARWPDAVSAERFTREVDALARLNHPAIVRYVAHGLVAPRAPYLAMEWLQGEDLEQRLRAGQLGIGDTVSIGVQLAEALHIAHQHRILHRDLKPGNVFLVGSGADSGPLDIGQVKLVDFGLARSTHDRSGFQSMTREGELVGTPGFIAPEQARGKKDLDERVDLYALGVLLYTCLTRNTPLLASHIAGPLGRLLVEVVPRASETRADVPAELDALIAELMSGDPEQRPSGAGEVAARLRRIRAALRRPDSDMPIAHPTRHGFWSLLIIDEPSALVHGDRTIDPRITAIASRQGARVVREASGSRVALLFSDAQLNSVVSRLARCAVAVRIKDRAANLAIATGHGQPDPEILQQTIASSRDPRPATATRAAHHTRRRRRPRVPHFIIPLATSNRSGSLSGALSGNISGQWPDTRPDMPSDTTPDARSGSPTGCRSDELASGIPTAITNEISGPMVEYHRALVARSSRTASSDSSQ